MAIYADVFKSESMKDVRNIFIAKPAPGKKSIELKMKRDALDKPVFRAPGRAADEYRTSPTEPLRAST